MLNQSQILLAIEKFIERVQHNQITDTQLVFELQELTLAFHYQHCMNVWYSRHIQIFIKLINFVEEHLQGQCNNYWDWSSDSQIQSLRNLVHHFYPDVLNERQAFELQEFNNQIRLQKYIERVLKQKARSLFVRVDLKYSPKMQDKVDIQLFDYHMKVLRNRISNGDRCFSGLEGFAWALEQGNESSGFHCHLMLIYDGHKHQNDFGLALAVGDYWHEITNGLGAFYTPNNPDSKSRFEAEGTWVLGRIERGDVQRCQNVIAYITYLAQPEKIGQHLRVKISQNSRSFGTGQ